MDRPVLTVGAALVALAAGLLLWFGGPSAPVSGISIAPIGLGVAAVGAIALVAGLVGWARRGATGDEPR